jgi:hypothetical protein
MDVLLRIKGLLVRGRYRFTHKAVADLHSDGLDPEDAVEAILNAQAIKKTLRSRDALRRRKREKLYIIESFNYRGTLIYTKGKFAREVGTEVYYLLISSKIGTLAG